jgi:hypothetical protein
MVFPMHRDRLTMLAAAHSFEAAAATTISGVFCICVHGYSIYG